MHALLEQSVAKADIQYQYFYYTNFIISLEIFKI